MNFDKIVILKVTLKIYENLCNIFLLQIRIKSNLLITGGISINGRHNLMFFVKKKKLSTSIQSKMRLQ